MAHKKLYDLPPTERQIIPPIDGWRPCTYYRIYVSFSRSEKIGFALFYSGFLMPDGMPGKQNQMWNPAWGYTAELKQAHYLRVAGIVMKIPKKTQKRIL